MSINMEGKFEATLARIDAVIWKLRQPYSPPIDAPCPPSPLPFRSTTTEPFALSSSVRTPTRTTSAPLISCRHHQQLHPTPRRAADLLLPPPAHSQIPIEEVTNPHLTSTSLKETPVKRKFPKFPFFKEGDPRKWICEIEEYFDFYEIPGVHKISESQKLNCATLHLRGRASQWFHRHIKPRIHEMSWSMFLEKLIDQFDSTELEESNKSIVVDEENGIDDVSCEKNRNGVVFDSLENLEMENYRSDKSSKVFDELGSQGKKILKKTLKEGEGYEKPNDGAVVTVKLIGKLQDGTVFVRKGHDEEELFEWKTDEEQVIEGLDRAVMAMKKGEIALVTIPPEYAFSSTESKQDLAVVPPNSTVTYEIALVSIVKDKESWDLNTAEKIEAAGLKEGGQVSPDTAGFEALENEGRDMEIDLSNLGTVNTVFAALFSKLGVPIKTTISATVLEEALSGTVTVRPLPLGSSLSGMVEKQDAQFFGVTINDEQAQIQFLSLSVGEDLNDWLLEARGMIKSMNETLMSFIQEKAVIKQFSGTGYESSDVMVVDEVELQRHQQLERLYKSTRAARDLQKDIIRTIEALPLINNKHIEVGTKLSEDCYKYGGENMASDGNLAKAASLYGGAIVHIEKEFEDLNKLLASQIMEPLRAMATGAPLEDARHLAQRYSRMRGEAELLAAEISRRQLRVREAPNLENTSKLQASETKMRELKSNMAILGKEAATALSAVESQQQRLTYQRLISTVEAEKSFHLRLAAILDDVEAEMVFDKQRNESIVPSPPSIPKRSEKVLYFLAEAIHAFSAASEKELSLAVGDYVVVRQVTPSGWSEGECKGKGGWFPSAFVEKRQRIPTNKILSHEF